MNRTIPFYVGFDQVESVAYHVFEYSIQRHSSIPVAITPLRLSQLTDILTRERHALQTNDFSFSRWLVPYLCDYKGWAIFADCDMLCRADIARLWALRDNKYAVKVVKHNHVPREDDKYLGNVQTKYEKKNWSSVMLINCEKCTALTPEYVNGASGLDLHQFKWLKSEALIGELPNVWNQLVGYDFPNKDAKIAHFTIGGPYFTETFNCEFAAEWWREYQLMSTCEQIKK